MLDIMFLRLHRYCPCASHQCIVAVVTYIHRRIFQLWKWFWGHAAESWFHFAELLFRLVLIRWMVLSFYVNVLLADYHNCFIFKIIIDHKHRCDLLSPTTDTFKCHLKNAYSTNAASDTWWLPVTPGDCQWHLVTASDTWWLPVTPGDYQWHLVTTSDTWWLPVPWIHFHVSHYSPYKCL